MGAPPDADIEAAAARAGALAAQAAQPEVAERGGTPDAMLRPKGSCTRTELIVMRIAQIRKLTADRSDLASTLGQGEWHFGVALIAERLSARERRARRRAAPIKPNNIPAAPYAISSFTVSTAYRTVFDQNQPPLASKASFTDPAFGTTSDVCRLCTRRVGP